MLQLSRLKARYRLPAGDRDARARLDHLLRAVVDEALEHALSRCGIPAHEEICIRAVHVPVELRMSAPDSALIAAWSVALAGSIGQVIEAGGPDVVRYRTRTHALTDLLLGVAVGDYARAWVWRRLDLWRIGDAPPPAAAAAEVVRALLATPGSIVPAMAAAARAGALPRLVLLLPGHAWSGLVAAALDACELPIAPLLSRRRTDDGATSAVAERRAAQVVTASSITRAMREMPAIDPELRRLLVLLAILEIDPTELDRGASQAHRLLSLVECEAAARAPASPTEAPTRAGDIPARLTPTPVQPADVPAHAQRSASDADDEASGDRPLPELPRVGATEWGGLLFLLHIVDDLQLPAEILRSDIFGARTLRWVLHRLAMRLTGADARDPACLAFAATTPDDVAPSEDEEAPTDEESHAMDALAARVAARLHERMRGEPAPDSAAARAVARSVMRRRAGISCAPGWFDVLLRLDEVSVEVRRAGLDLDPGWIPWLGAVVRFVYE